MKFTFIIRAVQSRKDVENIAYTYKCNNESISEITKSIAGF